MPFFLYKHILYHRFHGMADIKLFKVPAEAGELETAPAGDEPYIYVTNAIDLSAGDMDAQTLTEETIDRINTAETDDRHVIIFGQETFNSIYSICRHMNAITGPLRLRMVDCLARSLTDLNELIYSLLQPSEDPAREGKLKQARHALKAHCYFLMLALTEATKISLMDPAALAAAPKKGRGRKAPAKPSKGRKAAGSDEEDEGEEGGHVAGGAFDATSARQRALEALSVMYQLDLKLVFQPEQVDEPMIQTTLIVAYACLADRDLTRSEIAMKMLSVVIGNAALIYNQHETVASTLFDLLNRYDFMPQQLASLCFNVETMIEVMARSKLTLQLVLEIAHVDPSVYAEQQKQDSQGLKNVGSFLSQLAAKVPKSLLHNLAMLEPHLGGEAYTLRMEIVTAIGILLVELSKKGAMDGAADVQQAQARLKTKGRLMETLLQRVFDTSGYVRNRAVQAIEALVHSEAVDIGKIVLVTEIAVGRLEDKVALVRKSALRLLQTLLTSAPFVKGGKLQAERFETSLGDVERRIEELRPRETEEEARLRANPFGGAQAEGREGEDPAAAGPSAPLEDEEGAAPLDAQANVELDRLRGMAASLKSAIDFVKALSSALPLATQLLASTNETDIEESINFLVAAVTHDLDGARPSARKMLPLIFAKEPSVRDCVLRAVESLYLDPASPLSDGLRMVPEQKVAVNLIELAKGSSLGELSALEEILTSLVTPPEGQLDGTVDSAVLEALFAECERAAAAAAQGARGAADVARTSMQLLSMVAGARPDVVVANWEQIVKVSLASNDGLLRRYAAVSLQRMQPIVRDFYRVEKGLPPLTARKAKEPPKAPSGKRGDKHPPPRASLRTPQSDALERLSSEMLEDAYVALTAVILCPPGTVSGDAWYSAAEAAVTALYLLHPSPDLILQGALVQLHGRVASQGADRVSTDAISRLLFVLGHTALQELLHVEVLAKEVRLLRLERDRAAGDASAEAALRAQAAAAGAEEGDGEGEGAGGAGKKGRKGKGGKGAKDQEKDKEKEDIAAQIGVGSNSATEDAELDQLADQIQKAILANSTLVGKFGPFVQALCRDERAMASDPTLRSTALLTLTKLMAVDDKFCDENLSYLFTWLENRGRVEPEIRSNIVVGLGDLMVRHPNTLEPWTENVYRTLSDPDAFVRRNAVMVVSHLILNDMMKARGNISHLSKCLVDPDERIQGLTQLFFQSLSEKKGAQNANPIYNLLPDILSNLSVDAALSPEDFRKILGHLLQFVSKDRQTEALVEKLVARFEMTRELKQWRDIAYCLAQLNYNEKMIKKLAENVKKYKEALHDDEVLESFASIVTKSRRLAKEDLRKALDEFEEKLRALAEERKDQAATENAAQQAMEQATKRGFKRTAAAAGIEEGAAEGGEAAEEAAAAGRKGGKAAAKGKGKAAGARGRKKVVESEDEEEEEEETKPVVKKARTEKGKKAAAGGKAQGKKVPAGRGKKRAASESESEDETTDQSEEEDDMHME